VALFLVFDALDGLAATDFARALLAAPVFRAAGFLAAVFLALGFLALAFFVLDFLALDFLALGFLALAVFDAARGGLTIMRRTASVAAVTIAAPILLALSAAASAPSSASRPAFFALWRTFWFVVRAAAAATRPAASMLRARGLLASSANLSVAALILALEPALRPVLLVEDFAIAVSYVFITGP
jgi:hypothetical protein